MKIFFLLFSIYMITLSCMPCNDDVKCSVAEQAILTADHNKSEGHCEDFCQPFCSCSCCASPVIDQNIIAQDITTILSTHEHSLYCNADIPQVYFPVWQPPQLV